MKKFALLALIAGTTTAMASTSSFTTVGSVTFNGKNSVDVQGDIDNAIDSWVSAAGGSVSSVRVTGSLTEVNTGTFASEARVRLSAGSGNSFTSFNVQATSLGGFTGTTSIGPVAVAVTPFTLAAGGTLNFEWFESFDDEANAVDAVWDTVTYEFGGNNIINGNFNLGAANPNGVTSSTFGSNVASGLDFYSISLPFGVSNVGDFLNVETSAGADGSTAYDSEIAIYDAAGNFIATDDDGAATALFSRLNFTSGLASGNYTIVVGGFNTAFGATLSEIIPGTAAGSYSLDVTYVPAPASIAFLGLGALVGGRRRR